jgi:hypothetical protein
MLPNTWSIVLQLLKLVLPIILRPKSGMNSPITSSATYGLWGVRFMKRQC